MRRSSGTQEPQLVPHFRLACSASSDFDSPRKVLMSLSATSKQLHTRASARRRRSRRRVHRQRQVAAQLADRRRLLPQVPQPRFGARIARQPHCAHHVAFQRDAAPDAFRELHVHHILGIEAESRVDLAQQPGRRRFRRGERKAHAGPLAADQRAHGVRRRLHEAPAVTSQDSAKPNTTIRHGSRAGSSAHRAVLELGLAR